MAKQQASGRCSLNMYPEWCYNMFNAFNNYIDCMSSEVPAVDKLKGIYKVLRKDIPGQKAVFSGYTGFVRAKNYDGYVLEVETLK